MCPGMKHFLAIVVSLFLLLVVWGCGGSEDIVLGAAPEPVTADESLPDDSADDASNLSVSESTSAQDTGVSQVSDLRISTFLWKPVSEGDGNLVVLIDPVDVDVLVTGSLSENLTDSGPSNGRGTTARGSFPGCSYGRDILIEFFEASTGRRILLLDGSDSVRIDDGCNRVEF